MASKIDELIYKLGLEVPSSVNTAINIEAGKAGYEKYLADYAEETARYNELSDKKFKNWSNGKYNPNGKYEFYQLAAKRDTESVWMPTAEWTEDDRMRFGEKYARNKDEAIAYGRSVNDAIKTKAKEQKAEKIAVWTEKNAFNSTLASIASVPINFVGGIIDTGMNTMEYLGTGDIQTKDKLSFTDIANTMQGTVAENLNERFGTTKGDGVLGGKGLGDVYGLAMSIAQSVAAGFTGGVGMASMFSMAASNTTSDALSRGVSADKAMLLGIVSGTAEMALEKLSFEKLLKVSSAEGVSNVFKGILKQAGQEATEEGLTSIINEFADRFIAADKSNYQLMVNQLIASGMSVEDAKKEAGRQIINGIMYDTIAGAASGGISAAGGIGLNRVNNQLGITKGARTANAEALQMYAPVQNELIEKGKQHETSQKVATKMESKLAEGKELSGYDLRKLASETYNAERTADVETTRKAIVEKMKTEGLDDAKAKKLGEIALNKAIGNDVSKVQDVMLKNNEIATKVYRQISEEMMDSGVGDSQWAEETPIRRLRAEKEAVKQNEAIDVENRHQTGLEKLKADIARKYGVNTKEYKINVESLEGKFTVDESNKIRYKKTEDSKIHTDGISSSLTQEDIIELSAIEKIANELGIDIYVYETKLNKKTGQREYADKDGKRYTDSGYYDTKNNTIHIDLRAGMKGEGTMLYTASHEVVHFIKENASDHFDELENLVTKALADGGYSVEKLIDKQKDILKQNGWDGTEANFDEVAREEMVADACMKFLASKNAVAEIRALKTENKGLWTALKKFFTSLFNKINKIYKTVPPDSAEAKYIADMRKAIKPIRDAFFEGAATASKNSAKTKAKEITNKAPTKSADIRYSSRKSVDLYSEKEYNNFGWARANNVLSAKENTKLRTLFADAVTKHSKPPKTQSGEYMIAIGDEGENKITYMSGTIDNPIITRVLTIDETNETKLDELRRETYALERRGIQQEVGGIFDIYTASSFRYSDYKQRSGTQSKRYNNQLGADRGAGSGTTQRVKEILFDEEGNEVKREYRYSSRSKVTPETDATYLSAVKRGDMETAQRMVDEAAKAAGYTERVFHGTRSGEFYVFDENRIGDNYGGYNAEGGAFDFTYDKSRAWLWAGKAKGTGKPRVIDVFIKAEKPFYSYDGAVAKELFDLLPENLSDDEKKYAMSYGIPFKEVLEQHGIDFKTAITSKGIDSYMMYRGDFGNIGVYSPFQIKSADPVTYDDNGKVIPLSERFNEKSKDIRHKARGVEIKNAVDNATANSVTTEKYIKRLESWDGKNEDRVSDWLKVNRLQLPLPSTKSNSVNNNISQSAENVNTSSENSSEKHEIRSKTRTTVTTGQYEQMKANLSHSKVYSKKSAMDLVRKVAPGIRNRSFESLSNQLWEGLNSYTTIDDKRQFAEDMSQMFIDRMTVDTLVKHSEWDSAVEKMAYLKTGIGTIDFRDQDAAELKYKLDKKYMSLRSRWGYKKNSDGSFKRSYGLDEFISDLSREMPGMEYLAEMHPAEALLEVDKLYTELSEQIKEKYEGAYDEFSIAELEEIRQSIAYEIMNAYTELGDQTKISKYLAEKFEYYQTRIDFWKAENAKTKKISRWHGIISTKALQIKELKKGAFYNATQHHQDVFKGSIEKLANIQWRGNLKPTQRVSEIFADLKQWYTMDNPMLYNSKDADNSLYSDTVATYITKIADSKGAFTEDTYAMVYDVMNHLYTMMRNYNKVFRNGRWEDAPELVDKYLKIMEETVKNRNAFRRLQEGYNTEFLEPMAVAKRADNYNESGFFTQTMEDLRRASIDASVGEMNLRKEYDAFVDKNKKYLTNAAKETVTYRGHEIPKIHLIGLYMTMKREHARAGLALNGFEYTIKNKWWDSEDHVYVKGYVTDGENVTQEMINEATFTEMRTIEKSFTEIDKQYIDILEKLFNEDLKRLKVERDMERQGYTNAVLDYYYPILRGAMAENVDTAKISDQNRATNASFNKNTVKGARQRLVIISADSMVNRHINDMCKYYYMSQAIENYNVLYNCDVSGNANDPMNIAKLVKETKVWEKDVQYFKKLVSDMQGIRDPQTTAEKALEALRGNYAAFALGLNVKVLFTQFSSMIAAGDVISFGSILSPKALTATSADVDTYCPLAAVRNYDAAVIKAMSVSDKVGKVSKALTLGIGKVDRLVVRRLFAACQVEAEKRGSGKIGTEENKIAAGKLLEQVIIETQQNSYATERSQAMRSKNEFLKAVTMFTADGMKIVSRMHEAYGEMKAAKNSGDKAKFKKARRKFARSVAVAVNIAIYMTAIACLFNWIYDRDDEEEDKNKMLSLTMDTIGNFISALPILSDLYDFMVDGFEVESPMMDTVNNIFAGINNIRKDAVSIIIKRDGERSTEDINRDLRTLLYGVGQATGLPFRNIYNLSRGFIGHFTRTGGYKLDSKFYETSLASDFEDAIEKGDNYKASYVMSLIYDERVDKSVSEKQSNEIARLSKLGYNVLPKTIPDEVKKNGKTYTLTASQKDTVSASYAKVTDELDRLISSGFYQGLNDEEKAYMIDYYHDNYYEMAINQTLRFSNNKTIISNILGFGTYAKLQFVTKDIESDKDENGKTIAGSKKQKVIEKINKLSLKEETKLLYITSLGYSITDDEKAKLIKYLNSLNLSKSTKERLADLLDLEYKNGKITAKS